MKKKTRKLGPKNSVLFVFMAILFVGIIGVFAYFISYQLKKANHTYNIANGGILFDYKNNYIELKNGGVLTRGFDKNYYISYTDEESNSYKEKLGKDAVVFKEGDYKLYFYGTAYMIASNGEVEKVTEQTEIVKSASPFFFKISDRKYMFVDKKLQTSDGSIKTTDYLIVEIDKQGNATFINFENNVKTIKPLILKGTQYDFDIANEKLIIGEDKEVDLKTVIGSSNLYEEEEEDVSETVDTELGYYDEYFNAIKNSFNNLSSSMSGMNENIQIEMNKEEAYLDLTRWTTLKNVSSDVNSIKINYAVFDPNNEYSEIFVSIKNGDEVTKYQLSKSNDTYTITNLIPDHAYEISYGYKVVKAVGDDTIETITDSLKVKTKGINYKVKITKITSSGIHYKVIFNNNYIPSSCEVTLYNNDNIIGTRTITEAEIKNGTFQGYFDAASLEYLVILKLHQVVYAGSNISYETYAKFIN